ncbi:hypothetical protein BP6252_08896 [Coleophoma cylindrospora]|uniref:UBC core domain-containing protein n=1 Tax=Coleophoma cylindrospora TaxID=1849047 RepID=A0A3D8R7C0_9HELO|nr:hypothetical protein BP6252_08896 [Coleophoma cylindrospora]
MSNALKQRLLHDIAEMQAQPYPNIALHVHDEDITTACLVLTTPDDAYGRIHLTMNFPSSYPLRAPQVRMDSDVNHPNIFSDYICASILNTTEGYTPAYTLKGIAIQLLSFFTSDNVEQVGSGRKVSLSTYRDVQSYTRDSHQCTKCRFGLEYLGGSSVSPVPSLGYAPSPPSSSAESEKEWPTLGQSIKLAASRNSKHKYSLLEADIYESGAKASAFKHSVQPKVGPLQRMQIPDEILLKLCDHLETEDLMMFAQGWSRIGQLITHYDVIRTRELQCFCFKKDYTLTKLGVGVSLARRGKYGFFQSEFDLLSHEGFARHYIRRSVQGVSFNYWLPLPISNGHWRRVKDDLPKVLSDLAICAGLGCAPSFHVIFRFMNDVVVKLNQASSETVFRPGDYHDWDTPESTLTHASEKAIESYFHLFHLLLCMATADPMIVHTANRMLAAFMNPSDAGKSKDACPDLGHLLIAALISDFEMTPTVIRSIIKEAVTRNVVWMLESHPELSYYEPSAVSPYRLKKTFEASTTSYRLLMFLNLFRRTAVGSPRKSLIQLRDEAFQRHGAPPRGSAKGLANAIKTIHSVNSFPAFLRTMGIAPPTAEWFTSFLRECIKSSMAKGYSRMPITQGQALLLRQAKEPGVEVGDGWVAPYVGRLEQRAFFPDSRGVGRRGGRRGHRGGRGGRGGHGHGGH